MMVMERRRMGEMLDEMDNETGGKLDLYHKSRHLKFALFIV
jgi:hypothetical protein